VLERDGEGHLGLLCEITSGITHIPKERSTMHKITPKKGIWICHILHRNCLLKHVIEDKIAVTGKRGKRHKQLPNDLTEKEDTGIGT
jgi:hypothetical protein